MILYFSFYLFLFCIWIGVLGVDWRNPGRKLKVAREVDIAYTQINPITSGITVCLFALFLDPNHLFVIWRIIDWIVQRVLLSIFLFFRLQFPDKLFHFYLVIWLPWNHIFLTLNELVMISHKIQFYRFIIKKRFTKRFTLLRRKICNKKKYKPFSTPHNITRITQSQINHNPFECEFMSILNLYPKWV